MKKFIKLFGIITILVIIFFSLTGCGQKDTILTVVNHYVEPITYVGFGWVNNRWSGLNITSGNSQSFVLEIAGGGQTEITVSFGGISRSRRIEIRPGNTYVVTLSQTGMLSVTY